MPFSPRSVFFLINALKSGSSFISLAALMIFFSALLNIENCRLLPVIKGSRSDLQSSEKNQQAGSDKSRN